MSRPNFGWSYPPGCSGPPEYDITCPVCLGYPETDCRCEECPVCGEAGNPDCYVMLAENRFGHGMFLSHQQLDQVQDRRVTGFANLSENLMADADEYDCLPEQRLQ